MMSKITIFIFIRICIIITIRIVNIFILKTNIKYVLNTTGIVTVIIYINNISMRDIIIINITIIDI